jgi:hypothetical protein
MKTAPERDPVLQMVDAVLRDLSVGSPMYVGRRSEAGDPQTFVIQTGEEGRFRLRLPDLTSDISIQTVAASAQAHIAEVLGVPVPLCPRHDHSLAATVTQAHLMWLCPEREWQCGVGDYAELAWPHFGGETLAPILAGRLRRRRVTGVVTIAVTRGERGPVAEFGVNEQTPELVRALRDAAAPLPIAIHREKRRVVRVDTLSR